MMGASEIAQRDVLIVWALIAFSVIRIRYLGQHVIYAVKLVKYRRAVARQGGAQRV